MTKLTLLGAGGPVASGSSYTDDFNRSNENLEANANWTRVDGAAGAAAIVSNILQHVAASGDSGYYDNRLSATDHYAQFTWATSSGISFTFPLAARVQDGVNAVVLRNTGSEWGLWKRVAGTTTSLATYTAAPVSGNVMRLEASGGNVRVLRNGIEIIGWTSLGGDLSSQTRAGLVVRASSSGPMVDSWECGSL